MYGGAERVLQALLKVFPEADVYTSYADLNLIKDYLPQISIKRLFLSFIQNTPFVGHNSLLQAYSPLLWRSFKLEKYDIVISNSSYMLCNLIEVKKPIHIQYILAPPKNLFNLAPYRPLQKILPYTQLVSNFYKKALHSTPYIITDSIHIQQMIYELSGVSSKVIYPPVRIPKAPPIKKKLQYYIIVSRIEDTKNIDFAIRACNYLKLPLKIIGKATNPKYERHIKSIAGSTIEFLGMKTDEEIDALYQSTKGFIFTAKNEDFGIAPLEAMAHGVPVIAYYGGGVKETITDKKTGLFFYKHNPKSLIVALKKISPEMFNSTILYEHAKQFSEGRFCKEIKEYIKNTTNFSRQQVKPVENISY